MADYTTISKDNQRDVLQSYWTMLRECETKVECSKDSNGCYHEPLLKHWVEGWYEEWNRVTGDSKKPSWSKE